MFNNLRLRPQFNLMNDTYEFYLVEKQEEGRVAVGQPVVMVTEDMAAVMSYPYHSPTFWLRPEQAQALMDDLFNAGVRPSEMGYPGQLAAVKYHLEDMRRLVFEDKNT